MSMGQATAVISFPIKLVAGEGEEAEAIEGAEEGIDQETLDNLTEFIKTTDKQGLQTLSKFAKNPSGAVQNELMSVLGKAGIQGAFAVAIISLIIGAPEIIRTIVKAMSVKGGMVNQDFHRFFEDEAILGFTREMQYRRSTGLDVIITNDSRDFLLIDPGFVGNSIVSIEQTRTIRNTAKDLQYGYMSGM